MNNAKNIRRIEVMAPAGSYEALTAAWQGGANAVYFGVGRLNMRSGSASNFSIEDLHRIVQYAREKGMRSYLTVNTVVYDEELEEMHRIVDAAKEANVSAIIASDPAVITYARSNGVEVHLSTQTNVTNLDSVRFWSAYADVIVTARELSLEQVKNLIATIRHEGICGPSGRPLEIEIFVHGALCMAVSGKCYLSLDNELSSGNRGACLQLCRRPYRVMDMDSNHEFVIDNEYIMSPKDLCTIGFLNKILDAGVTVLKIEGRGRPADYVKTVTECYREAADYWLLCEDWSKAPADHWMERLRSVYNRDFWDGYYLGKRLGEWTETYGNRATRRKIYAGKVTNFFSQIGVAEIKVEANPVEVGDTIMVIGPTTGVVEDVVREIRVDHHNVSVAGKGTVCSLKTPALVRRGDKIYRVVSPMDVDDGQ
jgi:U32 family peptidase